MLWQGRLTPQSLVLLAPFDEGCRGISSANRKSLEACQGQAGGHGEAALETTAKSVGQNTGRSDRFRWQRHAAGLLGGQHRVGLCRWSVVSKAAGVDMVASSYGEGADRVHYEGLQTCGSVWACPCCSARISETRRDELGRLLSWARAEGYHVRMVTLTCRHGRDDDLADLMLRLKGRTGNKQKGIETFRGAKQRLADDRRYKELIRPHVIGSVTATEVTGGGAHGWHPHLHMILILDDDIDLTPMRDAWLGSLRGAGLEGSGQGGTFDQLMRPENTSQSGVPPKNSPCLARRRGVDRAGHRRSFWPLPVMIETGRRVSFGPNMRPSFAVGGSSSGRLA